jgi:hypothetical protein
LRELFQWKPIWERPARTFSAGCSRKVTHTQAPTLTKQGGGGC